MENDAFKADVAAFWADWPQEKCHYTAPTTWWDLGKSHVKQPAIDFSIRKQKGKRLALRELQAALQAERTKDAPDLLHVNQLLATLKSLQIQEDARIFIATHSNLTEQETTTKLFVCFISKYKFCVTEVLNINYV